MRIAARLEHNPPPLDPVEAAFPVFPPYDFVPAAERGWLGKPSRTRAKRRRKSARGHAWLRLRDAVHELTGGRCYYCGELGEMTVDHRVALSKGGSSEIDNLVPACADCNRYKASHDEVTFLSHPRRARDPRFSAARRRVGLEMVA